MACERIEEDDGTRREGRRETLQWEELPGQRTVNGDVIGEEVTFVQIDRRMYSYALYFFHASSKFRIWLLELVPTVVRVVPNWRK
jgi:hypothetical protein